MQITFEQLPYPRRSCLIELQRSVDLACQQSPGSRVEGVIARDGASIEQKFAVLLHLPLLLSEVKFAPTAATRASTQGSAEK